MCAFSPHTHLICSRGMSAGPLLCPQCLHAPQKTTPHGRALLLRHIHSSSTHPPGARELLFNLRAWKSYPSTCKLSLTADQNACISLPSLPTEVLQRCRKTECQESLKASEPDKDIVHGDILASLLQSLSPRMRRVHHALLLPPQPPPEPQPTRMARRHRRPNPFREGF